MADVLSVALFNPGGSGGAAKVAAKGRDKTAKAAAEHPTPTQLEGLFRARAVISPLITHQNNMASNSLVDFLGCIWS